MRIGLTKLRVLQVDQTALPLEVGANRIIFKVIHHMVQAPLSMRVYLVCFRQY